MLGVGAVTAIGTRRKEELQAGREGEGSGVTARIGFGGECVCLCVSVFFFGGGRVSAIFLVCHLTLESAGCPFTKTSFHFP